MRDPALYPFFADIETLPGVGPKVKPVLARLIGGETVLDLLFHLPASWVDRRVRASIADAPFDQVVTITGVVDAYEPARGKFPARIRLRDETGFLTLVYFRASPGWLSKVFRIGARIMASGMVTQYKSGERQILHPDYVLTPDKDEPPPPVEPIYPMTQGLAAKNLRKFMAAALAATPDFDDWIDPHLRREKAWPRFREALETLHRPDTPDAARFQRARERLAYDESFARELAMAQARMARQRRAAPMIPKALGVERQIVDSLAFKPTRAQLKAFRDVSEDLTLPHPMRRLVQGDVGSGKTLVAALAAGQVAAAGGLTAIMSPTEVLARQQAEAFNRFLAPAGMRCAVLTGRDRGPVREQVLQDVRAGRVQALSGTQALYQSDVELPDLALVVIDEQHRFGVADRLRLSSKGEAPHLLVMSATPIPRTLAMSVHGDMDVSIIDEKPAGRQEVVTAVAPDTRVDEVMDAVARAVARGERAYWICPTVDPSEEFDDSSAVARRETLAQVVGGPVELVHGRLSGADRDAALERFRSGASRALVATTVVEVGVDVPDATIIVIERCERFGLAQLHQLRGRVGRSDKPSSCLLLYRPPLTDAGRERLDILRKTTDGFAIAEADFALRGPGDLLGLRQSGLPEFRVLSLIEHADLIETSRSDVKALLTGDPRLEGARGRSARLVRELLSPRVRIDPED
jgi:ATP-dependent DNA helicase RecG